MRGGNVGRGVVVGTRKLGKEWTTGRGGWCGGWRGEKRNEWVGAEGERPDAKKGGVGRGGNGWVWGIDKKKGGGNGEGGAGGGGGGRGG